MDPLEGLNINGDSTFVLGLGAQERGHTLFHYEPHNITWREGRLLAHGHRIELRREKGNHFTKAAPETVALDEDFDVILLRQDPPFDMGYITSTYLLELAAQKRDVKIINDPVGVRNAPEKLLITHFAPFIPPTLISSDAHQIAIFVGEYGDVVAKRLYGNAGRDVFRFTQNEKGVLDFAARTLAEAREPIMLQPFMPEITTEGDKRIILFGGEVVGAFRRLPAAGDFRANLAQGGTASITTLTPAERQLCDALAPLLQAMGLYFVGLDVIGGKLIEINVTSPTGLQNINNLYNLVDAERMEMRFWQGLEESLEK